MPTINEDHLRAINDLGRATKERLVRKNRGPVDPPMLLTVVLDNGEIWSGHADENTYAALDSEILDVGSLIYHSVMKLVVKQGLKRHVARVHVTSDAHMRKFRDPEEASLEEYRHGDFARDHATNPESQVVEAVVTWVAEFNDESELVISTIYSPYHYDDGGAVVWDDGEVLMNSVMTGEENSNVARAMVKLFETAGVKING